MKGRRAQKVASIDTWSHCVIRVLGSPHTGSHPDLEGPYITWTLVCLLALEGTGLSKASVVTQHFKLICFESRDPRKEHLAIH